ncbi:MAG: DUF5678 domain-containing protein [Patescibacteria group bacterium]
MAINWTTIYKKYRGQWVALKSDEKTVVASGRTVKSVMAKAEKKGYKRSILMRLPTRIIPYVGGFRHEV